MGIWVDIRSWAASRAVVTIQTVPKLHRFEHLKLLPPQKLGAMRLAHHCACQDCLPRSTRSPFLLWAGKQAGEISLSLQVTQKRQRDNDTGVMHSPRLYPVHLDGKAAVCRVWCVIAQFPKERDQGSRKFFDVSGSLQPPERTRCYPQTPVSDERPMELAPV